jgi:hypothetical protein
MLLFGERVATLLNARLYVDAPVGDVDNVFIVGMYDPPRYAHTIKDTARAKHRHIHWCGTDVLLLTNPELLPEATHTCDGDALREELFALGIDATVVWTPTAQRFEVRPLPPEKRVGVYIGSDARKYGASALRAVQEVMDDHEFVVYGHGQVADMEGLMGECRAYLRLTRHDGGACSAREYMEAGRRAVITTDLPHAKRVRPDDLVQIVRAVRQATSYDEPDWDAAAFYSAANSDEAFIEGVTCLP